MVTSWMRSAVAVLCLAVEGSTVGRIAAHEAPREGDLKAIAEEAFVYGFPMVMNYGVLYETFLDRTSSQFRTPLNEIGNTARVFTPKDTSVVTPNSDTPYSMFCADLRAEPFVFTVPRIEPERFFSFQLIDLYTFNYGYVGSRTTGNGGGSFMIAGPSWMGEKPEGIDRVFRCETEFTFAIVRTQLFRPDDLSNVVRIQSGYRLQPLSSFLKTPAPASSAAIAWPKIDKGLAASQPFAYLGFLLQFCPPVGDAKSELPLRARLAKIGIEPGKPFPSESFSPEQKAELAAGIRSGIEKINAQVRTVGQGVNGWRVTTRGIGDRSVYAGDWLLRAAVARAGIYANDPAEAIYPILATDSDGNPPDGHAHRYTLTFPAGELPPVDSFWSVTMYDAKTQLLIENPIDRYLINSPMLPDMAKDADGSLTLYLQKDSPGKAHEANWLPAPDGPIYLVMRLYRPRPEALELKWKPPALKRVD